MGRPFISSNSTYLFYPPTSSSLYISITHLLPHVTPALLPIRSAVHRIPSASCGRSPFSSLAHLQRLGVAPLSRLSNLLRCPDAVVHALRYLAMRRRPRSIRSQRHSPADNLLKPCKACTLQGRRYRIGSLQVKRGVRRFAQRLLLASGCAALSIARTSRKYWPTHRPIAKGSLRLSSPNPTSP